MKVLQLGKFYPPVNGGIETVTFDLTENLNRAGVPTDVLVASPSRSSSVEQNAYRIFRAGSYGTLFSTSLSIAYVRLLHKLRKSYDIITIHMPNPLAALAVFLVRPRARLVLLWHSDIIRQKHLLMLFRPLERWLLRRAGVVVGPTAAHVDTSDMSRFMYKRAVIPFSIDADAFAADYNTDLYANLRKAYADKLLVFGAGRLTYYKGFQYLIKAAAELNADIQILIGGTGPEEERLRELIHNLDQNEHPNRTGRFKLMGRLSQRDLVACYRACDVFCLPSTHRSEMFGVVQLEAMACGKPVISTDIPRSGVPLVNRHAETGLIVPPGDVSALKEALHSMQDSNFRTRLAERAFAYVRETYRPDTITQQWRKLYADLMRSPDKRD